MYSFDFVLCDANFLCDWCLMIAFSLASQKDPQIRHPYDVLLQMYERAYDTVSIFTIENLNWGRFFLSHTPQLYL